MNAMNAKRLVAVLSKLSDLARSKPRFWDLLSAIMCLPVVNQHLLIIMQYTTRTPHTFTGFLYYFHSILMIPWVWCFTTKSHQNQSHTEIKSAFKLQVHTEIRFVQITVSKNLRLHISSTLFIIFLKAYTELYKPIISTASVSFVSSVSNSPSPISQVRLITVTNKQRMPLN